MSQFLNVLKIIILFGFSTLSFLGNSDTLGLKSENKKIEPIISGGYDFSMVRMPDGSLWSWGSNEEGQLGLGDKKNRINPTRIDAEIKGEEIEKILLKDQQAMILTSDGRFYRSGRSSREVIGTNTFEEQVTPDGTSEKIKDIARAGVIQDSNNHHTFALLTDNGKVYTFGSYHKGGGGRGLSSFGSSENCTRKQSVSSGDAKPVLVDADIVSCDNGSEYNKLENEKELENIEIIEGSNNDRRFIAVNESGEIYSWGQGSNYKLFATKNENSNEIEGNIVKLVINKKFNYALTDKGDIWKWEGYNGEPENITSEKEGISGKIEDFAGYDETLIVLTEGGKVYGKGKNNYGQLDPSKENFDDFKELEFDDDNTKIKAIGMGYRHSLFVDEEDNVSGMGWNSYRQLANEKDGVQEEFRKTKQIGGVTHIASNQSTSYAVKNKKDLYAWGESTPSGDFSGLSNTPVKIKSSELGNDIQVMTLKGSPFSDRFHTVLQNGKGNILTWGHNWRKGLGHEEGNFRIGKLDHKKITTPTLKQKWMGKNI